ncbi:disease resistance protein RPV1-like [Cucumis melo]|uniref:TMV resistance protein N-like isoform X1 n=1 Tax=Cucumis melo TaxID=3656 RepID=A0A1S4DZW3_CUCME|nr:disease resistance protein RPV1-like [Cucumis melo]
MDRASGSFSSHRWRFDVFLSFRGEDTRFNFTSHLYTALRQRGINVFIDDSELTRGENFPSSLLRAIEESKISVVIISENYATSSWCLNELVYLIMCKKLRGQVVLPIFYKVNPSQVRTQNGAFGEAFAKLEVRFFDKMQAWREALTTVSFMSGWVLLQNDDEARLIQIIVRHVWKKLTCSTVQLSVTKYPVGIDRQVKDLLSHVIIDETRMVGLYGIGGMGKTTLAKALYNRVADKFEGCCFLANIREASKQHDGLVRLQEKLLYDILMYDFVRVGDVYKGINIIRNRLYSIRILLILDDIDTSEQLQVLAGGYDWFGHGSKVIVTTRNEQLLDIHGFYKLKEVPQLHFGEALELFSWHAFHNSCPPSEYSTLPEDAVNYCKNLPLALEVLGSFLYSTDQSKFKGILEEFANSNLNKDIQKLLQVSYDELEGDVQEMFLFISCFFVGEDKTMVEMMLKSCGCLCWENGIKKLMNLSLLTINRINKVQMHDLIKQMGHTIARSRTFISHSEKKIMVEDEAMHVLDGINEARAVKAIKMEFPNPTELDIIDSNAFSKVKNLAVLKVKNVTFSKISTLDSLPNSLRWMSWSGFPFSSFPSSYSMENIIQLKLPHSSIKRFEKEAFTHCKWLKELDLSNSIFLEEIPDLSAATNLEKLSLSGCENLVKVHKSVGSLGKLVDLCISSHVYGFEQFPSPLKLKSLKRFSTYHCTIVRGYPQFSKEMESSLEHLWFYRSSITELSSTIRYLTSLKILSITDCKELTTLPSTIYDLSKLTSIEVSQSDLSTFPFSYSCPSSLLHLTRLDLYENKITNLDFLETIAHAAPSLRELNLSNNNFSILPSCIVNFKSLRFLETIDCKLLKKIPKIPEGLIYLDAQGCISLAKFPDNLADFISCDSEHVDGQFKQLILMNCDIPDWFSYKSRNNPITLLVPSNDPSSELKVFAACVKFQVNHVDQDQYMDLECKVFINDIQVWSYEEVPFHDESRSILIKASPHEYMWLLVLYPHINFRLNSDDIINRSQEINLHQPSFGINSIGRDNNNCNVDDDYRRNHIGESIWRKFTVSFGVTSKFKDSELSIKTCGVHVIMEEWCD